MESWQVDDQAVRMEALRFAVAVSSGSIFAEWGVDKTAEVLKSAIQFETYLRTGFWDAGNLTPEKIRRAINWLNAGNSL